MGYLLELKLLLWKNFTLKRRKPVMLIFELLIPLVLFVVLVLIRRRKPAVENPAQYYFTRPLPSAGLMGLMQAFCESPPTIDEYGFPNNPNSTILDFLTHINTVGENYNFFEPGFTLDELQEVPKIYRSIIEDPLMMKEYFEQETNIELTPVSLLKDPNGLLNFMTKNLSFHERESRELIFNSTIERKSLFQLLFHNPNISVIFDPANGVSKTAQSDDNSSLKEFGNAYKEEGLLYSYMRQHDVSQEVFEILLIGNNTNHVEELSSFIKNALLDETSLSNFMCVSSNHETINVLNCDKTIPEEQCRRDLHRLTQDFCRLSHSQRRELLKVVGAHVDMKRIHDFFENWNREEGRERMVRFSKNVETVLKFKLTVRDLYRVSETMPQEYCNNENSTNVLGYEEVDSETSHTQDNVEGSNSTIEHEHPNRKLWKAMQKTVCGADVVFESSKTKASSKSGNKNEMQFLGIDIDDLPMSSSQRAKFKMLVHTLYRNPKVLYVPTGKATNKIIEQANRTFAFFDTVTNYASTLANVSEEIKAFLALNSTEYNLFIIRKIQHDMLHSPFKKWFIADGTLRDFLEDKEITDRQTFINQLDIIGIAACSWKVLMRGISFNVFRGFRTEDEMIEFVKHKAPTQNLTVLAGVVFYMNDDGSLPNHMIYKIRQNASYVRDTQNVRNPVWFPGPGEDPSVYYELGFLWIQDVLERAMINLYSGRDVIEPGSYIHHMPYPCYVSDQFIFMIDHVLALCLTVSWVYSVAMLVQHIVYEKEQRLKEVMKMMGMRNSIHWIAWFISSFVQMTVTIIILTIILKYGKVLAYSNPWIIFLTMEIFAVSIIMFSFLVSVLFSKAKIAAACAGILYFMSYVPYLYIMVREEGAHEIVSTQYKLSASFLAPTALGLAVKFFSFYEEIGQGMHWTNIDQPPSENHGCNLAYILGMLLVDSVLYLILFWYIENVHPGAFGIPKPWNFPFTRSYWLGITEEPLSPPVRRHAFRAFLFRTSWWNSSQRTPFLATPAASAEHQNLELEKDWKNTCEDEPTHLPLGVSISKLCKKYKNASKFAVHNLNLNLYEGQITALLGPTGSGKTTLMSILTGLYPPTTGSAQIYGHDIGIHMEAIRNSLGLCPQHNVLFDELTVAEHIWFYSRLKHGNNDVDAEAEKLIIDLDLPHKRNQKVDCLSGGMKRRLSVAIAFVGGSKAIFLDEPSTGVDPVARRAIWDLIIKYKKGRTILLSTHHMDEADILGDRIAIIENGAIKCCGSPLYLKHHLGEGYHLFIVKQRNESEFTSNCTQQSVTAFIRRRAPSVRFVKESKHELHYMLALSDLKAGNFVRLFKDMEKCKSELHISSYGVKNTTLEEIFMKVISERRDSESDACPTESNEHVEVELMDNVNLESIKLENVSNSSVPNSGTCNEEPSLDNANEQSTQQCDDPNLNVPPPVTEEVAESTQEERQDFIPVSEKSLDNTIDDPTLTPRFPVWQQFCAILKKRYLCTKRNLEGLISQILLPSFFVSVAMSVALTAEVATDLPELILSTAQFYKLSKPDENVIGLANNKHDLFAETWSYDATSSDIAATLQLPSGPGAQCVLKSPFILSDFVEKHHYTPALLREEFFDSMCGDVFQNGIPFSTGEFKRIMQNTLPLGFNKSQMSKERNYPICYCAEEKTSFVCPSYGFSEPSTFKSVTGDMIYDISGQNESQYYLYTADRFRLRRYGGLSLGLVRNYVPKGFGNKSRSLFGKIAVRGAAKVWYDANGYHSVSTYLNVLNNAILRANLPPDAGSPSGYGITVINHPWPNTHPLVISTAARDILQGNEVLISIFIIVAMSFVPASFALFVVYERYTRSSHLQLLSGVHPMTYLFANYIWDVCNYFVPAFFIVAILLIFDVPAYSSKENLPAVIVLFLMYGWCISPVMHCTSLIFNEPSSAYIFLIVINLFVGVTCIVTSFLLEVFSSDDSVIIQMHNILRSMFMVFPNYCLGRGLMDIAIWHYYYSMYLRFIGEDSQVKSPFSWDGTGKCLTAMVCTGLTFFIINFLIESKRFSRTRRHKKFLQSVARNTNIQPDEDVAAERIRVLRGLANDDILRVENLTKVYHTRKMGEHLAVDRLCFGVPPGECFGLLGVNSAGKSSTFKMLTGDTPITYGDAFINKFSVRNNSRVALKSIGYCPQVDALLDELTAREHLQLYARLRGVPSKEVDKVAEWALKKLDLVQFADRPCRTYSGGNRRKISTAIALIGSPSLIFLDEPTSGTDPRSRRFLWDLILTLVKEGRSIVFTSHSMEECEMLCTRLAIMVQGQFRCIGSTQHLKNKFGDGYSLTLRCNLEKDTGKVERYMRKVFPFAVLKEKHHNSLHYEIASQHVSLDDMFQKMEVAMKDMPILDYSVSQNTLDNVFINFVKNHLLTASNAGDTSSASTDTAKECTAQDAENSNDNML